MRLKTVLILLVAGFAAHLAAQSAGSLSYICIPKDLQYFDKIHEGYVARAKSGDPIGVLFLGDSITHGWIGGGAAYWKKNFEPMKAVNFGIGSDNTQGLMWRMLNGELDGASPKVVVINIGTNIIGYPNPDEVTKAITMVVDIVHKKQPKAKVVLMAIFPRGAPKDPLGLVDKLKTVASQLTKFYKESDVHVLDISDKLADNWKIKPGLYTDGVHLTREGYEVWGEALLPVLKSLLK